MGPIQGCTCQLEEGESSPCFRGRPAQRRVTLAAALQNVVGVVAVATSAATPTQATPPLHHNFPTNSWGSLGDDSWPPTPRFHPNPLLQYTLIHEPRR